MNKTYLKIAAVGLVIFLLGNLINPIKRFGGFPVSPTPAGNDTTNGLTAVQIKPVVGTTYAYTRYQNNSFVTSTVDLAAGNLFSFACVNNASTTRFIQFFNATTANQGDTAFFTFKIASGGQTIVGNDFFGVGGASFSNGIEIGQSATTTTLDITSVTSTEVNCNVFYK